jgi:hypothetical protein
MAEAEKNDLSQQEGAVSGIYETKFANAQAVSKVSGFSAHAIHTMLDRVHLESCTTERSTPVLNAMKEGLTEAQIAKEASLGKKIDSSEQIQQLRVAGHSALASDINQLSRDSDGPRSISFSSFDEFREYTNDSGQYIDTNPAPFMLEAVENALGCGKEEAAAKIRVALDDAQAALLRDSQYPNPKTGKKQPKVLTDVLVLGYAQAMDDIKDEFAANCGVEVSKGAVGKAETSETQEGGQLISLVAEAVSEKQRSA